MLSNINLHTPYNSEGITEAYFSDETCAPSSLIKDLQYKGAFGMGDFDVCINNDDLKDGVFNATCYAEVRAVHVEHNSLTPRVESACVSTP